MVNSHDFSRLLRARPSGRRCNFAPCDSSAWLWYSDQGKKPLFWEKTMRFHLYTRRLPATLLAALACAAAATTGISASGQSPTLQVTMESLIYDLKNPDAPRRLAAARSLGNARFQPAIPALL